MIRNIILFTYSIRTSVSGHVFMEFHILALTLLMHFSDFETEIELIDGEKLVENKLRFEDCTWNIYHLLGVHPLEHV